MKPALIFDTETTGLTLHPTADLHLQPHMIEFGGVYLSLEDGSVLERFSQLVDPREPITAEITKITGITDADLRGAPTFAHYAPALAKIFEGSSICVAHNAPFDIAIINGELQRHRLSEWFPWPARSMCTAGLYVHEWGRMPRLIELYEAKMGKPLAQTHRALGDVDAMVDIIQKERLWELMK